MPQPSAQQVHVDRYLTNMAVAWAQDQVNFVADKVFPMCPVTNESDFFATYDKGFFYRTGVMQPRPLGGRPPSAGYETNFGSYRCVEWSLEHPIDDRIRVNADAPLNPDLSGMRLLQTAALIQRDTLWTTAFFNTGIWATDWTGVASGPSGNQFTQWDQSGSDPIQFIRARANDVLGKTGYRPNVLCFGSLAYEAFINHADVTDRIKYTQAATAVNLEQAVASLLQIPKIVIARGVSNTAHEGQADNIGFIANQNSVLMAYAAPAPTVTDPSAGYTFAYTGLIPGVENAFGGVIMRGREELAHTDILQIRGSYDQKLVASDLAEFFQAVTSPSYSESTF